MVNFRSGRARKIPRLNSRIKAADVYPVTFPVKLEINHVTDGNEAVHSVVLMVTSKLYVCTDNDAVPASTGTLGRLRLPRGHIQEQQPRNGSKLEKDNP